MPKRTFGENSVRDATRSMRWICFADFLLPGQAGICVSDESLGFNAELLDDEWDYTIVRETRTSSVGASGTLGALTLTAKTREDYDDFSTTPIGGELGMKRLVSSIEAYDVAGQSPQTTTFSYIQTPANPTTHGRLESTVKPVAGVAGVSPRMVTFFS